MQRFQFRLERVLDWQVKVCHLEEEKLRQWRQAVAETENRLERLKADSLATEKESLRQQAIPAEDLKALARYRSSVIHSERQLRSLREKQLEATEQQLDQLSRARQRLRIIEKLRERAFSEHRVAVDREVEALALESHLSKWMGEKQTS
jgi:flagellar export protein FliJ